MAKNIDINLNLDTKKSKQNIDGVDKSVNNLNTDLKNVKTNQKKAFDIKNLSAGVVAGYAAIAASLAKVIQYGKETIDIFLIQDEMNQKSQRVFGDYSSTINDAANAMQGLTTVGNEQYQKLALQANSLGVENDKINETVEKSIGLSALWSERGITQEQVIEALAKANGGNYKALNLLYPALKSVTDETEKMRIINELATKGMVEAKDKAQTFTGQITQMKNAFGDLKELVGGQIMAGVVGEAKEFSKVTEGINKFSEAFEKTKFLQRYIEQALTPLTTLFSIFEDVFSLFGEKGEKNSFEIMMEGWMFIIKLLNFPLNFLMSSLSAIFKLITGDWKGAMKAIIKPFEDLLTPIINIGKGLGLISEDFELFGEEVTSTTNDVVSAVERFGGESAKQYNKIKEAQDEFLTATKTHVDSLILLTEDEKAAFMEKSLQFRDNIQKEISAYIEQQGIFNIIDKEKLKSLNDSLNKIRTEYDKDKAYYEKLNNSRIKSDKKVTDKVNDDKLLSTKDLYDRLNKLNMTEYSYELLKLKEKYDEELILAADNLEQINLLYLIYETEKQNIIKKREDAILDYMKGRVSKVMEITKKETETDPKKSFLSNLFGVDEDGSKQIEDAAKNTAMNVYSAISQIREQNMQNEMSLLDEKYNKELEKAGDNEDKKKKIEDKYNKDKEKLEKEQSKKRKQAAIRDAVINGAIGITSIIANSPDPLKPIGPVFLAQIGAAIASTAAQIAVISSQKFAKGGILKGPSHANGGILTQFGELEGGEAVINKRNTATFAPLLSKINSFNDNGLNFNNNSFIDYDLLASKINDKKVYVVDRDMTDRQSKTAKIVNRAKI